mgnify:CR=1 FL=1
MAKITKRRNSSRIVRSASSKRFSTTNILTSMWTNDPYNDNDLEDFENVHANTLAGTVLDKSVDLTMGGGIKPTLDLINKRGKDEQQIKTELEQYKDITDELKEIDQKLDFNSIVKDALRNSYVFGRCAVAFEPDFEFITALKIIHPRDLGRPNINQEDWTVDSVNVHIGGAVQQYALPNDGMIYIMHQPRNPIRRNIGYGFSMLQRVKGQARALERLTTYDLPEIVQSMWAGYGLFIVNTAGKSPSEAGTLLQTLVDGLKPGAFNAVPGKPEDITFQILQLQAQVNELIQSWDRYERSLIGNFGMPSGMFGREEEANRATMLGKIQLTIDGVVKTQREDLGSILSKQWYSRLLAKLHPELTEVVRVKAEFEPLVIENWLDKIDGIVKLGQAVNLKDEAKLKIAGLEDFTNDIEEREPEPKTPAQEIIENTVRDTVRTETARKFSLIDKLLRKDRNA